MPKKLLKKPMIFLPRDKNKNGWIIGVDGGGTKTTAALAGLDGKIIKIGRAGSSSPTNAGIEIAAKNIIDAVGKVLTKKTRVISTIIGLPAVQERPELIIQIKKEIFKNREMRTVLKGRFRIVSDQLVAFRSATSEKEGIVLIAGTGCVVHGWRKGKDVHVSGWGWLADEGSAFSIGQEVFKAVLKHLDGRGQKTLLTKLIFSKFKLKKEKDLLNLVYLKNPVGTISQFSFLCDKAAKMGDITAKNILKEAAGELAEGVKAVVRKMNFKGKKFPLVLVGGVLESKIVLDALEKEIKKVAPGAKLIIPPKGEAALGAVKLAVEESEK